MKERTHGIIGTRVQVWLEERRWNARCRCGWWFEGYIDDAEQHARDSAIEHQSKECP